MPNNMNKPGIKTSEFWIGTLTAPIVAVLVAALTEFGVNITTETIALLVGPAIAYIFSRGWVKKEEAKTVGVLATAQASQSIAVVDSATPKTQPEV